MIILQIISIILLFIISLFLARIDYDLFLLIGNGVWDSMLREQALKCGVYSTKDYIKDLKESKDFFDSQQDRWKNVKV